MTTPRAVTEEHYIYKAAAGSLLEDEASHLQLDNVVLDLLPSGRAFS